MSFVSIAPALDQAARFHRSAQPDAPQLVESDRPSRTRLAVAALLRGLADRQVRTARRLEGRTRHALAA